jgi:hypothetical protein
MYRERPLERFPAFGGKFLLEKLLKICKLNFEGSFQGIFPCNIIDGPKSNEEARLEMSFKTF